MAEKAKEILFVLCYGSYTVNDAKTGKFPRSPLSSIPDSGPGYPDAKGCSTQ